MGGLSASDVCVGGVCLIDLCMGGLYDIGLRRGGSCGIGACMSGVSVRGRIVCSWRVQALSEGVRE